MAIRSRLELRKRRQMIVDCRQESSMEGHPCHPIHSRPKFQFCLHRSQHQNLRTRGDSPLGVALNKCEEARLWARFSMGFCVESESTSPPNDAIALRQVMTSIYRLEVETKVM